MKQLIATIIFFSFVMVAIAQRTQPIYTYKQKQLADSLRMLFPDLYAQQDDDNVLTALTMPVLTLPNKETFDGETAKGKIYIMKPDNMRLLKSDETNVLMPNAINGKITAVPPLLTKP